MGFEAMLTNCILFGSTEPQDSIGINYFRIVISQQNQFLLLFRIHTLQNVHFQTFSVICGDIGLFGGL